MTDFLNTSQLDFIALKESFKNYLKHQSIFSDVDLEASNINVLLEIMAYNSYLNGVYLNMVGNENFMDSAVLRDTVISHAKELNYLPRSQHAAVAEISISAVVGDNPSLREIVIPKYSIFTTTGIVSANSTTSNYTFLNRDNIILQRQNSTTFSANGYIYEGSHVKEYFTVTSAEDQKFIISNRNIDIDSINVVVQASSSDTSNSIYTNATSLYGLNANSTVFFTQAFVDDKYEIIFGDNVFGKKPSVNNLVSIEYMISNGEAANGCKTFLFKGAQPKSQSYTILTINNASSGSDRETIKSIKFRAPRHHQAQSRAVTAEDYRILILNNFNDVSAVNVYGGEELDEPQYGKVFVSASSITGEVLSDNRKRDILEFLKLRTPLALDSEYIEPTYLNLLVKSNVIYNPTLTTLSVEQLKTKVRTAITNYNTTNLLNFDNDFRYSKFVAVIDASDPGIVSNSTDISMFKDYYPLLGTSLIFVIEFKNEIQQDDNTVSRQLTNEFTVNSSEFEYLGKPAFFGEDGAGIMFIYQYTSQGRKILNANCGTVNYSLGKIYINNIIIDSYSGSSLKFYATPKNKDIFVIRNSIIRIDSDLTNVTVKVV
ncbi:MAG: hypothetical protein NTZ20_05675 [Candidatus Levybacteria bacterium]|nr:hypothetical protein [Candidatus Levybacteria bacterium]